MDVYKIAYATGSRADYGIVRHYLGKLDNDPEIDLEILVTGTLLNYDYGYQVDMILKDGFKIGSKVDLKIDPSNNAGIITTMSEALNKFGKLFEEKKYDLLILLGDRYEILSVAIAAAIQKISILHIHGGEATFGNYDEFIRHSITKMSRYHFTATEEYRHRVIQLGENPQNVYYLGSLGAENCLKIDENNVSEEIKNLVNRIYAVVLFHPETLTDTSPSYQIGELLKALEDNSYINYIFLGSNADTYSKEVRKSIKNYNETHDNTKYYESLHTDEYHYLVKNSVFLIGNSSSGIIEAPSLNALTINIGNRQKGRIRGNSVMDVECSSQVISDAIRLCIKRKIKDIVNPYYKKNSCMEYYHTTKKILKQEKNLVISPKEFFDIEF